MVEFSAPLNDRLDGAVIAWSEDTSALDMLAAVYILPLTLYPMLSPNESVTNFKFITADGFSQRIPHLAVYSRPLDLGTWMTALGLFLIFLILVTVTSKSDNPRANGGQIMCWGLFWIYGILLDQADFPTFRKVRAGFRILICSLLVTSFALAIVVSNSYRSILNVNYVTGNEVLCPWSRLDQLINFSALYIPTGACLWKQMDLLSKPQKTKDQVTFLMSTKCFTEEWQRCKEMIDETLCIFNDELYLALIRVRNRGSSCWEKNEEMLGVQAVDDTTCFDPRIILLGKHHRIFQRFPLAELETYVKNQMTQPRTALLVTERTFPVIWEKFEDAMREDPGLMFSHNYLRDADSTLFVKQRARLFVA